MRTKLAAKKKNCLKKKERKKAEQSSYPQLNVTIIHVRGKLGGLNTTGTVQVDGGC